MTSRVMRFSAAAVGVLTATVLYAIPLRAKGWPSPWHFALSVLSNPLYLTYFAVPACLVSAVLLAPRLLSAPHLVTAGSAASLVSYWLRRLAIGIGGLSGIATAALLALSAGLPRAAQSGELPLTGLLPGSLACLAQLIVTDLALIGLAAGVAVTVRLSGRLAPAAALATIAWLWMSASTIGLTPAWLSIGRLFDAAAPLPAVALLPVAMGVLLAGDRFRRRGRT